MEKDNPSHAVSTIEEPPSELGGIIRRLGPGLIVAGSIVGSGELIATTKTGAEAGFWLLWLIVIGCVIKVFVQVEFGRYSIIHGKTTMDGLAEVPGPRIPGRGNWIVWYWFLMFLGSIGQLGGIVGGVGQALAISVPITEEGRQYNDYVNNVTELQYRRAELQRLTAGTSATDPSILQDLQEDIDELVLRVTDVERTYATELDGEQLAQRDNRPPPPLDDKLWAAAVAVVTVVLLVVGRYGMIQSFSTAMVSMFTLATVVNLILLQQHSAWAVSWNDIVNGMSFRLPPTDGSASNKALTTALATFGIIGVGASELVTYPYWCNEKGYARFTGPRDDSVEWGRRAQGWMRVMRWDAWCSMVIYTFATIAFYLLGAAILGRTGLNPEGTEMIRTLSVMYSPVFGEWAAVTFLFGSFAVLYSTYFVANASHARVFSDVMRVLGLATAGPDANRLRIRILSGVFPLLCLIVYVLIPEPANLVLLGGLVQAIMLPMLALAGLYFRFRRSDDRLTPNRLWDIMLWVSASGMMVAGVFALITHASKMFAKLAG